MSNKISVIIPTIKLDSWLDEAIESILKSEQVNVQLIVVLDGVKDEYLPEWSNDPRVEILRIAERSGQANAMNSAISMAKYELIARLDADDLSSSRRLFEQSNYLKLHPDTVAIGSRVMRIDPNGNQLKELSFPVGDDVRSKLLFQNVVAHSSLMFRKSALAKIGMYKPDLRQMEDYEFILRLASIGPIANLNQIETFYRLHTAQISRGVNPREDYIKVITNQRLKLASQLNVSITSTRFKNLVWVVVQKLRYMGLIKSGVDRF